MTIVYDTVGRLKWSVDIRTHPVKEIIKRVLEKEIMWEFGRYVPKARTEDDCVVSHGMSLIEEEVDLFLVVRTVPNGSSGIISLHPRILRPVTYPSSHRMRFPVTLGLDIPITTNSET